MIESTFERLFPTPKFLIMPAAGIDISDESVKYTSFNRKHGRFVIDTYGQQAVPSGVIESGKVANPKELETTLRALKEKLGREFVRVSLPEEQVYLFKIHLPLVDLADIRDTIELRLEEYVPLRASEVLFDYEIVEVTDKEYILQVSVLPRQIIESYHMLFEAAGLTPLSFELEGQAIARSVVPHESTKGYMVVDFGATRTNISITHGQTVLFTSTIDVGGKSLTELIQKHLNISFDEAEKLKRERGLVRNDTNEELFSILLSELSVLRDEINRRYVYWHSHPDEEGHARKKIEQIILCGGESNLTGLTDYFTKSLHVSVVTANPWTNVFSFDTYIPRIPKDKSLTYATSIGLALRDYWYD